MTDMIAEREHEHDLSVKAAEAELHRLLQNADIALRRAGIVLNDLVRGNAWHVEYAEGLGGEDAEHELNKAWRAVRHLQRIADKLSPKP